MPSTSCSSEPVRNGCCTESPSGRNHNFSGNSPSRLSSSTRRRALRIVERHLGLRAGRMALGRLPLAAAEARHQFAVAHQTVVAAHRQRYRETQPHAFEAFPVGRRRRCLVHPARRHRAAAQRRDFGGFDGGGHVVALAAFGDGAGHAHAVAAPHLGRAAARPVHEHGVGGEFVAVVLAGGVLQEEAVEAGDEVAGDHALHLHALALVRAARGAALHGAQRQVVARGGGRRRGRRSRRVRNAVLDGVAAGQREQKGTQRGVRRTVLHRYGLQTRRRRPEAASPGGVMRPAYFRLSTIHFTVAATCSSVSAGLPPRAGIRPASPW